MKKCKLRAGGHFLLVEENEIENSNKWDNRLVISETKEVEQYITWKVIDVGDKVGKGEDPNGINERFEVGDLLFAQPSKVNVVRFQGQTWYLVDEEFAFKVYFEEQGEDNVK